ncbi:MAG: hypothetical protein AAF664_10210 [Planctomycetota bacterium]
MSLLSLPTQFSVRQVLLSALLAAIVLGFLHIPQVRSDRFISHVRSKEIEDTLAMLKPGEDTWTLSFFEEVLSLGDVHASPCSPTFWQYLSCQRIVEVRHTSSTIILSVGLSSVSCESITEWPVSRGDF